MVISNPHLFNFLFCFLLLMLNTIMRVASGCHFEIHILHIYVDTITNIICWIRRYEHNFDFVNVTSNLLLALYFWSPDCTFYHFQSIN